SRDILIRRVGTRTYQSYFQLSWPSIFFYGFGKFRNWPSQVWRKRTVNVWLQFRQVDFNDLVKILLRISIHFVVTGQMFFNGVGHIGYIRPVCTSQVGFCFIVVSEDGGCGPDLSTHVTDGTFTGSGDGLCPFAEVLYNTPCTAFYGEDACHFEDNILCSSPSGKCSGQLYTDELGEFTFPR